MMKHTALHVGIAMTLMVSAITVYGPDDWIQTGAGCVLCSHTGGECTHKRATNAGMCWTNGGRGTPQCSHQETQTACQSSEQFYVVMDNFPQGEADNASGLCNHENSGVYTYYPMWTEHTYITSPGTPCYRTVECQWVSTSNKCEVKPGSEGPWFSLPRKTTNPCSPCL